MSNAMIVPDAFKGPVAPIFAGAAATEDLSGGITGGYGLIRYRGKVWSIHYRQQELTLMRDDGDGPRGSIDIVIVKANPQLSKTFYINGWDENNTNPPDCASANGIVPDQGVPHPQATICASCPKNAWGSAPNGGKGKACGDHRRLAVVPLLDLRNESFGGPLLLRCPAASLQDMAAFDGRYRQLGYPYYAMGIKIGFDATESFPKFTFQAIRPLTEAEGRIVLELRASSEVARIISESTAPVPAQVTAQPQGAFLEAPPVGAIQPQPQVQVQPAPAPVAAAPQPQPAPVAPVVPNVAPAGNGAGVAAQPVRQAPPATAGGFGPAAGAAQGNAPANAPAGVHAQPVAAGGFGPAAGAPATTVQQVAQRPAQAMTGFGGATAATPPPAAQQTLPLTEQAAPSPAVVSAFEGSIDDRLNALLNT